MLFADDPGGTLQPDPWPPDVTAGDLLATCAAEAARQALMKGELERILVSGELSSDVYEVVSKSLA